MQQKARGLWQHRKDLAAMPFYFEITTFGMEADSWSMLLTKNQFLMYKLDVCFFTRISIACITL